MHEYNHELHRIFLAHDPVPGSLDSVVAAEHLSTVGTGMDHVLTAVHTERDQTAA